ncbi:MAG: hypothetical protein IAE79_21265 [Anaerolinea sp.]|nr:hypothetical protein [Anaerolinea sp.]
MKQILTIGLFLGMMFSISACFSQPSAAESLSAVSVVNTNIGDFQIVSSRFEDEVKGDLAGLNEKILVVVLTQPGLNKLDPNTFSLEDFDQVRRDILIEVEWLEPPDYSLAHLLNIDDKFFTLCSMAGWLEEDFVIGCKVPAPADTYKLHWGENPPVVLSP